MLVIIEQFLTDLRERAKEVTKIANTKPFKEDAKEFTPKGVIPTQIVCWDEASAYRELVRGLFESIEKRLNVCDVPESNKFRSIITTSFEYNDLCFNKHNIPGIKDYFKFIKRSTSDVISEYFIHGEMYSIIIELIKFGPVYTEMLLTDAELLLFKVRNITRMLSPEEKQEPLDVNRLRSYYTHLSRLAFRSNDTTEAANYIAKLIGQHGRLQYRVLPPDYVEPTPPSPKVIPLKAARSEPSGGETNIYNYGSHFGNLNQGHSVKSISEMTSHFESGGGTQNNNTGLGSQNNGSGAQNSGAGTQNVTNSANKPSWRLSALGANSGWVVLSLLVVGAMIAYPMAKSGGGIMSKAKVPP